MAVKIEAEIGWIIQIVKTDSEADAGFYILEKQIPEMKRYADENFGGVVHTTEQAKQLMKVGYLHLK